MTPTWALPRYAVDVPGVGRVTFHEEFLARLTAEVHGVPVEPIEAAS